MGADALSRIVERVCKVPDRFRTFDRDARTAMRVFGIGGPTLSDLLDLGFPHRASSGERLFDELDLANASLALRLPSPRYLAMRRWPQVFRAAAADLPVRYEVELSPACGSAAPGHVCDFRLPAEVRALGVDAGPEARTFTLSRETGGAGHAGQAPWELQQVLTEVSAFQFHILPLALYGDMSFLSDTSLANCELASRFLAQRAAEEGWEARRSFGLLLSSPYSLHHFWPEVKLAGAWTAFDPFMVLSLERWGVLHPSEIPTGQVLDSAVLRVAEDWIELVEDAGASAPVSLLTRRREGRPNSPAHSGPNHPRGST